MKIYCKTSGVIKSDRGIFIPAKDYYFTYDNGERKSLEDIIKESKELNNK